MRLWSYKTCPIVLFGVQAFDRAPSRAVFGVFVKIRAHEEGIRPSRLPASMLGACYYMHRDGIAYRDLGADHFARHDKLKTLGRLVRRLHDLGYEVELKQVA
jgi:transposase